MHLRVFSLLELPKFFHIIPLFIAKMEGKAVTMQPTKRGGLLARDERDEGKEEALRWEAGTIATQRRGVGSYNSIERRKRRRWFFLGVLFC